MVKEVLRKEEGRAQGKKAVTGATFQQRKSR